MTAVSLHCDHTDDDEHRHPKPARKPGRLPHGPRRSGDPVTDLIAIVAQGTEEHCRAYAERAAQQEK